MLDNPHVSAPSAGGIRMAQQNLKVRRQSLVPSPTCFPLPPHVSVAAARISSPCNESSLHPMYCGRSRAGPREQAALGKEAEGRRRPRAARGDFFREPRASPEAVGRTRRRRARRKPVRGALHALRHKRHRNVIGGGMSCTHRLTGSTFRSGFVRRAQTVSQKLAAIDYHGCLFEGTHAP